MPRLYWLSATPRSAALRNHWAAVAIVGLAVDAFGVEHREIVHRLGVALVGGGDVEPARRLEVLLHALALLEQAAEAVLRGREAVIGRAPEPARRLLHAQRNAAAFGEAERDLVGRRRIAAGDRRAQVRAADRGRQFAGVRRRDGRGASSGAGGGASAAVFWGLVIVPVTSPASFTRARLAGRPGMVAMLAVRRCPGVLRRRCRRSPADGRRLGSSPGAGRERIASGASIARTSPRPAASFGAALAASVRGVSERVSMPVASWSVPARPRPRRPP